VAGGSPSALAAAAATADREERNGEATATDGQARRGQRLGPAAALHEPCSTGVSSPVVGQLAEPLRGRAR
jgi:hypothetical protein